MAYPLTSSAKSGAVALNMPIQTTSTTSATHGWPSQLTAWSRAGAIQILGVLTPPSSGQMWPRR